MTTLYMSVAEYAILHNRSKEMIRSYCRTGRIPGAVLVGISYIIPVGAVYPAEKKDGTAEGKRKRKSPSQI